MIIKNKHEIAAALNKLGFTVTQKAPTRPDNFDYAGYETWLHPTISGNNISVSSYVNTDTQRILLQTDWTTPINEDNDVTITSVHNGFICMFAKTQPPRSVYTRWVDLKEALENYWFEPWIAERVVDFPKYEELVKQWVQLNDVSQSKADRVLMCMTNKLSFNPATEGDLT